MTIHLTTFYRYSLHVQLQGQNEGIKGEEGNEGQRVASDGTIPHGLIHLRNGGDLRLYRPLDAGWCRARLEGDRILHLAHVLANVPVADLLVDELVEIQSAVLGILADAEVQAWDVLHDEKKGERHGERVSRDGGDLGHLVGHLYAVAIDHASEARSAIEMTY